MFDIEIPAPDGAASLAQIGSILGAAQVGLEGGGMWTGVAHYLVKDAATAQQVLTEAGLGPVVVRPVLIAELDVDRPGALGRMMRQLTTAGVTLLTQYSDHDNRKVLVVDDISRAQTALHTRLDT